MKRMWETLGPHQSVWLPGAYYQVLNNVTKYQIIVTTIILSSCIDRQSGVSRSKVSRGKSKLGQNHEDVLLYAGIFCVNSRFQISGASNLEFGLWNQHSKSQSLYHRGCRFMPSIMRPGQCHLWALPTGWNLLR